MMEYEGRKEGRKKKKGRKEERVDAKQGRKEIIYIYKGSNIGRKEERNIKKGDGRKETREERRGGC